LGIGNFLRRRSPENVVMELKTAKQKYKIKKVFSRTTFLLMISAG